MAASRPPRIVLTINGQTYPVETLAQAKRARDYLTQYIDWLTQAPAGLEPDDSPSERSSIPATHSPLSSPVMSLTTRSNPPVGSRIIDRMLIALSKLGGQAEVDQLRDQMVVDGWRTRAKDKHIEKMLRYNARHHPHLIIVQGDDLRLTSAGQEALIDLPPPLPHKDRPK